MCTTIRLGLALCLASVGLFSAGCASTIDPKLVYGNYDVTVAAFGKSDPDIVVVSQGGDADFILNFNYGVETEYNAVNATGLRVNFSDDGIALDQQPIRVTHSSGYIVGTVVGKGTVDISKISLTLSVTPTTPLVGADGQPVTPGGVIDYVVTGARL